MKKRKVFREVLNFSKEELRGSVHLMGAGIVMPRDHSKELDTTGYEGYTALGSFGWAGNDPKFYKDVAVSDLVPKPEDFIEQPFRLLSATTVGAGTWKATDFSNAKILKASMNKLNAKTVYKDHETDTDNWVGFVNGVSWSNGFKDPATGMDVPAGIDGILAIDAKTNPKVARGVMMGNLYSNSVTVVFDWEMSHEFESSWDFYNKVGTMGSDGKMIRRVVTEIFDFHETSLVWLGADPFSKAYDADGNLKHIDSSSVYEFSKSRFGFDKPSLDLEEQEIQDKLKKENSFRVGAFDKSIISLSRKAVSAAEKENSNNNEKNKNMEFTKMIAVLIATHGTALGLKDGDTLTADQFEAHLKKLSFVSPEATAALEKDKKELQFIRAKALEFVKTVTPEVTEVSLEKDLEKVSFIKTEDLETLKKVNDQFEKEVEDKRTEVERLYKVHVGADKVQESMIELFKKADDAQLDNLIVEYGGKVAGKFTGSCSKCGSTDISFQSSKTTEDKDDKKEVEVEAISMNDLRKEFGAPSMDLTKKREEEKNV